MGHPRTYEAKIILLFLLVEIALKVQAGYIYGQIQGSNSWAYLGRFCYAASENEEEFGTLELDVMYPSISSPDLLIYYLHDEDNNEFDKWASVYRSDLTCNERSNAADEKYNIKQFEVSSGIGRGYSRAKVVRNIRTSRPRWVFITMGNCGKVCNSVVENSTCMSGLDISYRITFTNPVSSNGFDFDEYFSFDTIGVLSTCLVFIGLYVLLLYEAYWTRSLLKRKRKYHHTVFLLLLSVLFSFASFFFQGIFLSYYAAYGTDLTSGFETTNNIFKALADFTLMLQVILIAKGWTIVRRKISAQGRVKIAVFMTLYVCMYWACEVYYVYGIDPADIAYIYNTWPGYILATLRLLAFAWFCHAIRISILKYRSKKAFYYKYFLFLGCWLLSLPLYVIVNCLVVEYYRVKTLYGLQACTTFVVQLSLVLMYNPKRTFFNSSFPFHATTTAMLHDRALTKGTLEGSSTFIDVHIRHAAELARKIKSSVRTIQGFSGDLSSFLDEIDPVEEESDSKGELLLPTNRSGAKYKSQCVLP